MHKKLADIWLALTYCIRALVLPDCEYELVPRVQEMLLFVYETWQKFFGPYNCVYNLHQLSHLVHIRQQRGALSTWSAFSFESMYGRLNTYKTSVTNPVKSMLTGNAMFNLRHN